MAGMNRWVIKSPLRGKKFLHKSEGFLLPIVIILGLAIGTVSVVALQTVSQNSVTTNDNYYDTLAREAAQAGKAFATSCIANNQTTWTNATPLKPSTDCTGNTTSNQKYVTTEDNYYSEFEVSALDKPTANSIVVTSKGYVGFLKPDGTRDPTKERVYSSTIRTLKRSTQAGNISKDVDDISSGFQHVCAAAEGQAYCWGQNSGGQLGSWNNYNNSNLPVEVDMNTTYTPLIPFRLFPFRSETPEHKVSPLVGKYVTKVAAGNDHSCAIADDKVYCWGKNDAGQLGNRTNTDSTTPVAVDLLATSTAAFAGSPAGCNPFLPPGFFGGCFVAPTPFIEKSALAGKKIVDVQAGNKFTCARAEDSTVACWGANGSGQLGVNDRSNRNYPKEIYRSDAIAAVPASGCVTIFFFTSCSSPARPAVPPSPLFGKTIKKIGRMSNNSHTCVIADDDKAYCWGQNFGGQVGNDVSHGTDTNSTNGGSSCPDYPDVTQDNDALQPRAVYVGGQTTTTTSSWFGLWTTSNTRPASAIQDKTIKDISTSSSYTTILGDDGKLYWWGGNTYTSNSCHCRTVTDPPEQGGVHQECSGSRSRYYNIVSRPNGPMFNNANTCYFLIFSFSCGDVTNVKDKTFVGNTFAGNSNDGTFCGQVAADDDIYCQAASPATFNRYFSTNCSAWGYNGQLGTGPLPNGTYNTFDHPALNSYCWSTNPVKVKMNGWLAGKDLKSITSGYAVESFFFFFSSGTQAGAFSCALASKQVGCWGSNSQGQLGTGDNGDRDQPFAVSVDSPLGKPGGGGGSYSDNIDY